MARNNQCPFCGEKGDVDSSLKCGACGRQLEYASADGRLKEKNTRFTCPRCGKEQSILSRHCESCGAIIGKMCPYCREYHYIEADVCPRNGEFFSAETAETGRKKSLSGFSMVAGIAIIFLSIFLIHNSHINNRKAPDPLPVATATISENNLQVNANSPRIDVVFVVDATGSMSDEIDVVKQKIREMVRTIADGQPRPFVRYGLVAFRDIGDEFITREFPLTGDIQEITSSVNQINADGGGDTPESVGTALYKAVTEMNWDGSANTRKMIFLIGDAAPHMDQTDSRDYRQEALRARNMGIKIYTIGCSGITNSGEREFREISQATGTQFEFLTYSQEYLTRDGREVQMLKAGDREYMVTGGSESDWKYGYRSMVKEKKAEEYSAEALPSASQPVQAQGDMKNNLDSLLTRQVQSEAEGMGVKYSK